MKRLAALLTLALAASSSPCPAAAPPPSDLVIYGGTSAGVSAAVQAKKMGKTAVIVCPDKHLGGLSSGGLGFTDTGNKAVIGGLSRDFYHRIWKEYQQPASWKWQKPGEYGNKGQGTPAIDGENRTMWIFEPHVAEKVFEDYVKEFGIPVHRELWLDRAKGVRMENGRIASITMLGGQTFAGRIFLDATYEGDLMAAAGVSYAVGREPNSKYGESLNGVQARNARSHQFDKPVDPYRVPGDPASGLLPRIHAGPPGEDGAGDHRVQAYCFRTCMTDHPDNLVPWPKPEGYDPLDYELALRYFQAGWKGVFNKFDRIPNHKTDTNNHGAFSFDNIGCNYDYPEASYERRREIIREHETYQKGLLWFIANDPRVPQDIQRKMRGWGLARDEFSDNGNWPHQIYVREARRMVGDFVVTELHLRRVAPTPRPVGMGSYNMDSHNVQRYVDQDGHARNEGDIQVNPGGPYPIDYGAMLPRQAECTNLLVPVCVSSSHIAYGSIRMEPVFMILGQSAATAAALAIDSGIAVQDLPYAALKARLEADGQILAHAAPAGAGTRQAGVDPATLGGTVVDDDQAKLSGTWQESAATGRHVGRGYRHDGDARDGKSRARFEALLPQPGKHEVRFAWTPNKNRSGRVAVRIEHAGGVAEVLIDERQSPPVDGLFRSLGVFAFTANQAAAVTVSNEGAYGHVVIDAVQWLPVTE